MRRKRDNIYQKNGKCQKYLEAQNTFQTKLKAEASKYKNKITLEVQEGKRGSGYSAIRSLGEGPAEWDKKKEFIIPAYVEAGLTPQQSVNRLADYFTAISQTVQPLDVKRFHPALQLAIQNGICDKNKPILSHHDVYRKLIKIKKPNSRVEGDISQKLIKEFPYLWAGPATTIFNRIIQTSNWPKQWKTEHAICLHKTERQNMVKSEEDVRTISKTNFLSKLLEGCLLGNWLLPIAEPYLDPGQCGGLDRTSTSHYLIKLLDFIHTTVDKRSPHAAVMAALDLSKAYNRGDSMVIEDLHAMHTPGWLLAILCSYLSSRTLILQYQKENSSLRDLPGGYSARTQLGGFLFIIKFNGICLRPAIPRPNGNRAIQYKFVDDASKAASINLKFSLIPDPKSRQFPLAFNERTQMVLDPRENILQQELTRFHWETQLSNLVANKNKTFIMLFNFSKKYAFPPEFTLGLNDSTDPNEYLKVKSSHKILGLFVQHDLRWNTQVNHMVMKASRKIWLLRRMRQLGVDQQTIASYWKAEGICHLEYCSPVYSGALTKQHQRDLARVHKRAVAAITGVHTRGEEFGETCRRLGLEEDLSQRRLRLAQKFARRTADKSRHRDIFERLDNPHNTRSGGKVWRDPPCHTKRHLLSARPYLTRLLNGETE